MAARRAKIVPSAATRARSKLPAASRARRARGKLSEASRASSKVTAAVRARATAAVRARTAPGPAASGAGLSPGDQAEMTRLRKVLMARRNRGSGPAEAILRHADSLDCVVERLSYMRVNVFPGLRFARATASFAPSTGASVIGAPELKTVVGTVLIKGLTTGGPPCRRTLAIYAAMRRQGVEHLAPLPFVYKVVPGDTSTMFHFEYMGRDTCKAGVSRDVFMELRAAAVDRLVKYGVYRKSISRAGKNWVIAQSREVRMVPTAYIIDAGGLSLEGAVGDMLCQGH